MVNHNNSTRRGGGQIWKRLGAVVFFLIFLPTTLTYLHLQYLQRGNELCFVGPTSSSFTSANNNNDDGDVEIYGIYRRNNRQPSSFSLWKQPSMYTFPSLLQGGLPSAVSLAKEIMSTVPTEKMDTGRSVDSQMIYQPDTQQWCMTYHTSTQDKIWCYKIGEIPPHLEFHFPPSGIWTLVTNNENNDKDSSQWNNSNNIMVSCAGPSMVKNLKYKPPMKEEGNTEYSSFWWPTKLHEHVRKNPNKVRNNKGPTKIMRQLSEQPTTTLLIAVNVLLALAYYSNRTSAASVGKSYADIVQRGQIWRSITGATAHFDIMHIGFNMMTLQSQGVELERNNMKNNDDSGYTSIQFLLYNMTLIPITTIIMMTITHLRIRWKNNRTSNNNNNNSFYASRDTSDIAEQYSVGYSGVLFSWMVISALEHTSMCPVFFIPDLCFTTYKLGFSFLKFNLSPLVSLLFCQFIMPRVSFVGHLSGIIAGFLLHWNLLPLEFTCPQVLYGAICIIFWHYGNHPISKYDNCNTSTWIKKTILAKIPSIEATHDSDDSANRNNNSNSSNDDDDDELLDPLYLPTNNNNNNHNKWNHRNKRKRPIGEMRKRRRKLLIWTKNLLLVLCVASFIFTNAIQSSSLFLAQVMTMISFAYMIPFYFQTSEEREDNNWSGRSGGSLNDNNTLSVTEYCVKIARGHIVIVVLTLVTDCMAMASWMTGYVYIQAQIIKGDGPLIILMSHPLCFILFAFLRIVINILALSLTSNVLYDLLGDNSRDNGIFGHTLGWTVDYCDSIATRFLFFSPSAQFTPFEGKGVTIRSVS